MARRAFSALLAVVSLLLAGCMSGDDTGVQPAGAADDGAAQDVTKPGAPQDAPPLDDGRGSMAQDMGHQPHLHDYWSGKERVTLFDGELTPDPEETVFLTLIWAFFFKQPMAGGKMFDLPEGAIVYEGTGALEITASWTDPRVTGMAIAYRSAAGPDYNGPVAAENGKAATVEVTPEMTDMPHSSTSRWQFVFMPSGPANAVAGPFRVKIDIVKMRDIALFPGHPELFEGKHEKVLLDADGKSQQVSYAKRVPNAITTGEFGEHWITPEHLVPMETLSMRVEVALKKAEASVGEVSEIRLYYRGADTFQPTRATLVEGSVADKRLVYHLPVEMEQTDSPYGKESQWRFLVEAATTLAGTEGERTCGGCVDTDIEFHVRVVAYDHDWQKGPVEEEDGAA